MPFERSCLYHRSQPMKVIEEDNEAEYKRLLASGEWFDHPNKAKEDKHHEEPIRQRTRKGRKNVEHSPKQNGS
jgi:hypothetical protein